MNNEVLFELIVYIDNTEQFTFTNIDDRNNAQVLRDFLNSLSNNLKDKLLLEFKNKWTKEYNKGPILYNYYYKDFYLVINPSRKTVKEIMILFLNSKSLEMENITYVENNKYDLKPISEFTTLVDKSNNFFQNLDFSNDSFFSNDDLKYKVNNIIDLTQQGYLSFVEYIISNVKHSDLEIKSISVNFWGFYKKDNNYFDYNNNRIINFNKWFTQFKIELFEFINYSYKYKYINNKEWFKKFKYLQIETAEIYAQTLLYNLNDIIGIYQMMNKEDTHKFITTFFEVKTNLNKYPTFTLWSWINDYLENNHKDLPNDIIKKYKILWKISTENKYNSNLPNKVITHSKNISNNINLENIFLSKDHIEDIIKRLEFKKNIIIKGQPGTGKSYIIQEILQSYGYDTTYKIQFSQNTNYSDFVEGFTPRNDNQVGFTLRNGVLKKCIIDALQYPNKKFALIIDEINRGNVSNIFGEIFTLIESSKRSSKYQMYLSQSEEMIYIPSNIYIVGTMNTVDKSLYNFDFALQRRFEWINFKPLFNQKLINYAKSCNIKQIDIEQCCLKLKHLNKKITLYTNNDDYHIGHSFLVEVIDNIKNNPQLDFITEYNNMLNNTYFNLLEQYSYMYEELTDEIYEGLIKDAKI